MQVYFSSTEYPVIPSAPTDSEPISHTNVPDISQEFSFGEETSTNCVQTQAYFFNIAASCSEPLKTQQSSHYINWSGHQELHRVFSAAVDASMNKTELQKAEVRQPALADITNTTKSSLQAKESVHHVIDKPAEIKKPEFTKPTYLNCADVSNPLFITDENQHSEKENTRRHEPFSDTTKTKMIDTRCSKTHWIPKVSSFINIFSSNTTPINL